MRAPSTAITCMCVAAFAFAGCGNGSASRTAASTTFAPCPSRSAAEIFGYYSEACLKSFIHWPFRIAAIPDQSVTAYRIVTPLAPNQLVVYYGPADDGVRYTLQLDNDGEIASRGISDTVINVGERTVYIAGGQGQRVAYWNEGSVEYQLQARLSTSDPAAIDRDLLPIVKAFAAK